MRTKLIVVLIMAAVAMLLLSGIALAEGFGSPSEQGPPAETNSVRITVGDGTPVTNVAVGDVVHQGSRESPSPEDGSDGEGACADIPGVRIQMSGDVRKVRVGLQDGTCNLVVKSLAMNNTVVSPPGEDTPANEFSTGFNTQAGWEWYVESLAKAVGINSIDDLTKTYAWFDFKMADFTGGGSVYDGNDPGGKCWAANVPQPPFYYYVDSCVRTSTDLAGPKKMSVVVDGEYYNTKLSTLDHDVTSEAIARGYKNMPHVFDNACTEDGIAYHLGMDFECELYWELVGYSND